MTSRLPLLRLPLLAFATSALIACSAPSAEESEASEDAVSASAGVTTCHYDPSRGPNLWGMRTYLTLFRVVDDAGYPTVIAELEQYPSNLAGAIPASIASTRRLVFHTRDLDAVRKVLRTEPSLLAELTEDPEGPTFAAWEATAVCDKTPASPAKGPPVACHHDPAKGPNPLGMRSSVTLSEDTEAVTVRYEHLPSPVHTESSLDVAVESAATLLLWGDGGIPGVRALLKDSSNGLAEALLGDAVESFSEIDATLVCR